MASERVVRYVLLHSTSTEGINVLAAAIAGCWLPKTWLR